MELIGPYLIGGALMLVAGVAKAVRPEDTARALAASVPIPLRTMGVLVRAGALAEAAMAAAALFVPRTSTALALGVSYAAFAVFVAYTRSRGGALASCGCFGSVDTPATLSHVVVNGGLAASAVVVAAAHPSGWIGRTLEGQPGHGFPLVMASALGAWLAYLVISAMARLTAARRLVGVTFRGSRV